MSSPAPPSNQESPGVESLRYASAPQRRAALLSALQDTGFAATSEIATTFGVSDMTVRRDVRQLEIEGQVRAVRGGVTLRHGTLRTPSFTNRAETQAEAKRRLARSAAALIRADDVIAVDSGTSTYQLAAELPDDFAGTVVTNSIPVIQLMLARPQTRLVSLGGDLVAEHQAFVGPLTVQAAANVRVRLFFLGAAAVDERGVWVHGSTETTAKHAMMAMADEVVLLADSSKFQRASSMLLCPLADIDRVITDADPDAAIARAIVGAGATLDVGAPALPHL